MLSPDFKTLVTKHGLISDQVTAAEMEIILSSLEIAIGNSKAGAVVEFGCYSGTTSLFIQRLLQQNAVRYQFHVYDSFTGLPEKSTPDNSPAGEQFVAGALKATKHDFTRNFKQANLALPYIHKGWFNQLQPHDIPHDIAFAFLDGDYYESIKTSLQLIESKLQPEAIIVVDDYQSESLPGAARAVDGWLYQRPGWTIRIQASLAILKQSVN